MRGLFTWLKSHDGPVLEAGVGKAILVLTSALVAAKLLPPWLESVAALLVGTLGWI